MLYQAQQRPHSSTESLLLATFTTVTLFVALTSLLSVIEPVSMEPEHAGIKVNGEEEAIRTVDTLNTPARLYFIRKVYGLVTLQIALAAAISVAMMRMPALEKALEPSKDYWMAGSWVTLIACLFWRKTAGLNLFFFLAFTICIGIYTGDLCAKFSRRSGENVVVRAFLSSMVVFVSMTVFVMFSSTDFSYLGPFCFVGLMTLVNDCLVFAFLGYRPQWWAWLGVAIFTGYIIYDTNQIMRRYSTDEFVIASLDLFLDVLNLFVRFLEIFAKESKR